MLKKKDLQEKEIALSEKVKECPKGKLSFNSQILIPSVYSAFIGVWPRETSDAKRLLDVQKRMLQDISDGVSVDAKVKKEIIDNIFEISFAEKVGKFLVTIIQKLTKEKIPTPLVNAVAAFVTTFFLGTFINSFLKNVEQGKISAKFINWYKYLSSFLGKK